MNAPDAVLVWPDDPHGGRWKEGRCTHCEREKTEHGHDPCIANLPNVWGACCGHGIGAPYVVPQSVTRQGGIDPFHSAIYGEAAAELMRELGGDPPATWGEAVRSS